MKKGPWRAVMLCPGCSEALSGHIVYNTKVCPHCGSAEPIMLGDRCARRRLYTSWLDRFMFWDKLWEYKA